MKIIAKFFKSTPILLMGVALFTSCMKDGQFKPDPKVGQADISFNFTTPKPVKVQTRASIEEENHVETLHLLIFNSGALVKTVTKTSAELGSSTTTTEKDTWELKTTLTVGKQYDFVTVANVPLPAATVVGVTKADFVAAINAQSFIDTILSETSKWVVSNTKPIPMWGEASTVGNVVSTDEFTIPLKRLMAKVNVSVAAAAQTNFKLTQVRFYNYNTKGQLIPNHDGTEYVYPSIPAISGKQTTATPAYFGYNDTDGVTATSCQSLIYVFENANIGKYSDGSATKWQDNPSVVIGGKFGGGGAETFYRLDFIKVESGSNTWLDVKRNHSYNFNITKVNGNGYPDPTDALMSAPINIEATVTPWDDGAVAEVAEDGQYKMGVSEKTYSFSKEPSANNALSIYTTYTQTDLVVKYSDSETDADAGSAWLSQASLTNDSGSDPRIYELKFNAAQNDDAAPRTAYIHLRSGRMHMVVRVEQSNVVSNLLVIENVSGVAIDAIEFIAANGADPGEQKYRVKWSPKVETLYIALASVSNPTGGVYDPLKWVYYNTESGVINNNGTTIYTTPIANGTGEVEFTIKPSPITNGVGGVDLTTNPFYERSQQINFRATGSDGTMHKNVVLQQFVRNMVAKAEGLYIANGSSYTFNVKSNRPWKAYLVDNGNGLVEAPAVNATTPFATGGYNLPDGANVGFTTESDLAKPTAIESTAKVLIKWLSGDDPANPTHWTDAPVDLRCLSARIEPLSNTYLVDSNSSPILIPVKRANGYGVNKSGIEFRQTGWETAMGANANPIGSSTTYTAGLVWTDTPHDTAPIQPIGKRGAVEKIEIVGNGEDGYILVKPGEGEGNAVVSVSVGGKIVWSWHIWVVKNYNPDPATNTWMDRNLGATSKKEDPTSPAGPLGKKDDVQILGLYYQWGRKDPIPRSGSATANTPSIYYLGNNTSTTAVTWSATGAGLLASIRTPLTSWSDWSGSFPVADATNTSWGHGVDKSVFDPCPDGWRVPVHVNLANTASTHHWVMKLPVSAKNGQPTALIGMLRAVTTLRLEPAPQVVSAALATMATTGVHLLAALTVTACTLAAQAPPQAAAQVASTVTRLGAWCSSRRER